MGSDAAEPVRDLRRARRLKFIRVTLDAPPGLADFYDELGIELSRVGETEIELAPSEDAPFYHFAFLVPGDRFEAAFDWAQRHVELEPGPDGELVFDFSFWNAHACYFEDPATNIVELIAHHALEENGARGEFGPDEIVGLSELALVGDKEAMAKELERAGIEVWSGSASEPDGLAFAGEKARTFILCPPGRGFLPSQRPAETHGAQVLFPGGLAIFQDGALVIERPGA